jgi:hypothetical protein
MSVKTCGNGKKTRKHLPDRYFTNLLHSVITFELGPPPNEFNSPLDFLEPLQMLPHQERLLPLQILRHRPVKPQQKRRCR